MGDTVSTAFAVDDVELIGADAVRYAMRTKASMIEPAVEGWIVENCIMRGNAA